MEIKVKLVGFLVNAVMKKLRISIVFVLSLIFFSKGASEENAPVFGGIENTTFANVVRNININASSTATVGYEVIGLRNHHQNATDSKFSAETLPDLEVEIVTLYPDIASERKQYMNWDRDYLINKFEKSGKNKTRFLTNLRMEYNRHPIINNSQSFQSQMEITRVPESNSTFNRQVRTFFFFETNALLCSYVNSIEFEASNKKEKAS